MPQLALQMAFVIWQSGRTSRIVYASIVFSLLSIVHSVVSMVSQRHIVKSRDYVSIEFEIKGTSIMANKKKCKNRVKTIQSSIASLLGLDEYLLETNNN